MAASYLRQIGGEARGNMPLLLPPHSLQRPGEAGVGTEFEARAARPPAITGSTVVHAQVQIQTRPQQERDGPVDAPRLSPATLSAPEHRRETAPALDGPEPAEISTAASHEQDAFPGDARRRTPTPPSAPPGAPLEGDRPEHAIDDFAREAANARRPERSQLPAEAPASALTYVAAGVAGRPAPRGAREAAEVWAATAEGGQEPAAAAISKAAPRPGAIGDAGPIAPARPAVRIEAREAGAGIVHVGSIEVTVTPPDAPPPARRTAVPAPPKSPLSRGHVSAFGLRQA